MKSAATTEKHTIRWFARVPECDEAPDGYLPRSAGMRGAWAWDVRCSCGWESRTGGAVESYVRKCVADHKWDVANGFWPAP